MDSSGSVRSTISLVGPLMCLDIRGKDLATGISHNAFTRWPDPSSHHMGRTQTEMTPGVYPSAK